MRIRQKLQFSIVLLAALGAVLLANLFWLRQMTVEGLDWEHRFDTLERTAQRLSMLTYELALYPADARPKVQWQLQYQELGEVLRRGMPLAQSRDWRSLEDVYRQLGLLQQKLWAATGADGGAARRHEQGTGPASHLLSSVLAVVQRLVTEASMQRDQYTDALRDDSERIFRALLWASLVISGLFLLIIHRIMQTILKGIDSLQTVTTRVANGDIGVRAHLPGNDELQGYAQAFNAMLDRLNETMASRSSLDREVAAHRKAEQELRDYQDSLEEMVRQRTEALNKSRLAAISIMEDANFQRAQADDARAQLQLTNDRLQQEVKSRKDAELSLRENERDLRRALLAADASNQAKSAFLASMSHELRTPLNAILGFSELLARDVSLSRDSKEKLAIINRSGEHLLRMINDVLDLSKIEARRMELEPEPCDLPRFLDDIKQMISVRAEARRLQLVVEVDPAMTPQAQLDVGKLRQILINLLGNAVKFTDSGGISMRARTQPMADDSGRMLLYVEVEDSGIGIAPDKLEDIFTPFVQAEQGQGSMPGTGLGLAIAKSLAELMGGDLEVRSVPGKGSLFTLRVPVSPCEALPPKATPKAVANVLRLAPGQVEWKVLVVDDNAENRTLLTMLLAQVGFRVREAVDGEQALVMFRDWRPHFVWMDMRMPKLDGYQTTRAIRALPGGDQAKIYAITASAFRDETTRILAAGCDGIVRKPYRAEEVYRVMEQSLAVRYLRQDELPVEAAPTCDGGLDAGLLAGLDDERLRRLHELAYSLDGEGLRQQLQEMSDLDGVTAGLIRQLSLEFRFDELLDWIEAARSNR